MAWPKNGAKTSPIRFSPAPTKAHVTGFPKGRLAAEEDPTRLLSVSYVTT